MSTKNTSQTVTFLDPPTRNSNISPAQKKVLPRKREDFRLRDPTRCREHRDNEKVEFTKEVMSEELSEVTD